MQELKVIGVDSGALVAVSDGGDRFRIAIDDVLQSRIKQHHVDKSAGAPKVSPREVQAHIRAGMSAEDVAAVTGADLEFVQRFEGPVVAERQHMVTSALSVPVQSVAAQSGGHSDQPGEGNTFGSVIRERLVALGAADERWASWKEPSGGWVVKLAFSADTIDHDARWGFEPKKLTLTPLNSEAVTLSQQGEARGSLIPRLRAVTTDPDTSRFDSGAFTFGDVSAGTIEDDSADVGSATEPIPYGRSAPASGPAASKVSSAAVSRAAIKRAQEPEPTLSETANLLEALRKRRGEREAVNFAANSDAPRRTDPVRAEVESERTTPRTPRLLDVPLATFDEEFEGGAGDDQAGSANAAQGSDSIWGQASVAGAKSAAPRKGRASMPSWDEIVFGARTDDDLA